MGEMDLRENCIQRKYGSHGRYGSQVRYGSHGCMVVMVDVDSWKPKKSCLGCTVWDKLHGQGRLQWRVENLDQDFHL